MPPCLRKWNLLNLIVRLTYPPVRSDCDHDDDDDGVVYRIWLIVVYFLVISLKSHVQIQS